VAPSDNDCMTKRWPGSPDRGDQGAEKCDERLGKSIDWPVGLRSGERRVLLNNKLGAWVNEVGISSPGAHKAWDIVGILTSVFGNRSGSV
jgi:hypothetical protein